MTTKLIPAVLWSAAVLCGLGAGAAQAADLIWEVENPFRFFRVGQSFDLHERAYKAALGRTNGAIPNDVIWRIERRLNDPACKDASTPDRCAATARSGWDRSRLGWAARTVGQICYDSDAIPRRYLVVCSRRYSWGAAKEDYVAPNAHTVNIRLAPERLAGIETGTCTWNWRPRGGNGNVETRKQACKATLTIPRVPYASNRAASGVAVSVTLPNGTTVADPNVVVEDLFVVALGDSFSSGESNPDKPVTFSPTREMVYDPAMAREDVATRSLRPKQNFGLAAGGGPNPKVLPRRAMEDEANGRFYHLGSTAFLDAFEKAGAQWVSRDCHRSQYGYPFRVGIQLALENRHRAVTLVSLTCTGADVVNGLLMEKDAREATDRQPKVRAQLDQLSDLICRGGQRGLTQRAQYTVPVFAPGSTKISRQTIVKQWCPPDKRKRPVDLVLMSIGGNDVGFSGLVMYSLTDSAGDVAPIASWIGQQIRYGTNVTNVYLSVLDQRMSVLKSALQEGFGISPSRVVQSSYEPIQYDERGEICGAIPTLGMDVHPKLKIDRGRLQETATFLNVFLARLQCISNARSRNDCPRLATGAGTGFTLVVEHQKAFARRGVCARNPKNPLVDGIAMGMPRSVGGEFKPYPAAYALPYAHRWRLFHTPNDAFLTANTHREGISPFDILQPAYAGLYSGAIHPTAEGHAIVADYVMKHARRVVDKGNGAASASR